MGGVLIGEYIFLLKMSLLILQRSVYKTVEPELGSLWQKEVCFQHL